MAPYFLLKIGKGEKEKKVRVNTKNVEDIEPESNDNSKKKLVQKSNI